MVWNVWFGIFNPAAFLLKGPQITDGSHCTSIAGLQNRGNFYLLSLLLLLLLLFFFFFFFFFFAYFRQTEAEARRVRGKEQSLRRMGF